MLVREVLRRTVRAGSALPFPPDQDFIMQVKIKQVSLFFFFFCDDDAPVLVAQKGVKHVVFEPMNEILR